MAEQLQLDFTKSATQRTRKANKNRDQLTLFAAWAPNIDISLYGHQEAVAHISGKETDRAAEWLKGLVGSTRPLNRRRHVFPAAKLDRVAWVRPPARITLDGGAQVVANSLHAQALGCKPVVVAKVGRRVVAHSPRGWPAGLKFKDAPWPAIEALINSGVKLNVDPTAEADINKKLSKAGTKIATASLSGTSILLETERPSILEARGLPGLAYVGSSGDGRYRMPLLLGQKVLDDPTIAVEPAVEKAIRKAVRKPKDLIIDDPEFPWTLWDFQATDAGQGKHILETTGGVLFAGSMGSGKANRNSTRVMTPDGPVRIDQICVGDRVLGPDGLAHEVRGVYPQGLKELYEVTFSDGTSAIVCGDHLWAVNTPSRKRNGSPMLLRSTLDMYDGGVKYANGNRKYYIPLTEPLQFTSVRLPVPSYTLGAMLGDGHLSTPDRLEISDNDGDVVEEIKRELSTRFPEVTFTMESGPKHSFWRLGAARSLREEFEDLGLIGSRAWEKFVPSRYLYAPVEDRLALLQGLLDTDGGCAGRSAGGKRSSNFGHVEFSSTSQDLADAVVWLTQSLGGTAKKSGPRRTTYTQQDGSKARGRPSWRVRVSLPSTVQPFRIDVKRNRYTPRSKYQPTRGIESIKRWGTDYATCIQVDSPDSLYVIEDAVVTHNTTVSLGVVHALEAFPMLVVGPLASASTWQRQLGEMGKNYFMATGNPKKDWDAISEGDYDAYFVTYDRLETFADLLRTKNLKVIIADEIQKAKNARSRRSRALRSIASAAPYRIGLSGTPLVGGLSDLLAQFAFLLPTEFPPAASKKTLEDRYPTDPTEALTDHIHSAMVRRRMDQVGKRLAAREDHKVFVNLTPDQQEAIREIEEEAKAAKEAGEFEGPDGRMNALVKLGRIRKVINNPKGAGIGGPNPKLEAAVKLVREAKKDDVKPVIFVQDRKTFADLGQRLSEDGIVWDGINGSTPTDERIEVERKLHALELDAVLCSFAAAEAWSASPTSTMCIIVSPTYSAAVNEQAESRCYRLNSRVTDTVRIVYLHAKDPSGEPSSDDRLFEILAIKKELFAQVIDRIEYSDDTDVSNSMSDLLFLLTGEEPDSKTKAIEADQERAGEKKRRQREHAKDTIYRRKV